MALNLPTTPTVEEVRETLQRHPDLLWHLMAQLRDDPPRIAGPWIEHTTETGSKYDRQRGLSLNYDRHDLRGRVVITVYHASPQAVKAWHIRYGSTADPPRTFYKRDNALATADNILIHDDWSLVDD